jgi:hypothetical protein
MALSRHEWKADLVQRSKRPYMAASQSDAGQQQTEAYESTDRDNESDGSTGKC